MFLPQRYTKNDGEGHGGMGEIWFCHDNHLQRPVVMKLLKEDVEQGRFIDEQKALIKLRSKHVVQLFDVINIQRNGQTIPVLVLEHIDGQDLQPRSFQQDNRYLQVLWQIACGLADIHQANMIHRDIKPNNIRQDSNGVIKIYDFGLSRSIDQAKTINVIGTLNYMAPELWQDVGGVEFNQAIDVYAFGITALNLLGIALPNELTTRPPRAVAAGCLMGVLDRLDPALRALLERCLAYQPGDRPTMSALEIELRKHLLKNRHKALLVMGGQEYELNDKLNTARLGREDIGVISIDYDGFDFKIAQVVNEVRINNEPAKQRQVLSGAAVITLGVGKQRLFATFDVSHPEVLI